MQQQQQLQQLSCRLHLQLNFLPPNRPYIPSFHSLHYYFYNPPYTPSLHFIVDATLSEEPRNLCSMRPLDLHGNCVYYKTVTNPSTATKQFSTPLPLSFLYFLFILLFLSFISATISKL